MQKLSQLAVVAVAIMAIATCVSPVRAEPEFTIVGFKDAVVPAKQNKKRVKLDRAQLDGGLPYAAKKLKNGWLEFDAGGEFGRISVSPMSVVVAKSGKAAAADIERACKVMALQDAESSSNRALGGLCGDP